MTRRRSRAKASAVHLHDEAIAIADRPDNGQSEAAATTGDAEGGRAASRNRRRLTTSELLGDGEAPCAFALRLMRDGEQPLGVRLNAAKIAAPYLHPKPLREAHIATARMPPNRGNSA